MIFSSGSSSLSTSIPFPFKSAKYFGAEIHYGLIALISDFLSCFGSKVPLRRVVTLSGHVVPGAGLMPPRTVTNYRSAQPREAPPPKDVRSLAGK